MPQLPSRKFVSIPSNGELEVGALNHTTAEAQSYHHIDLILALHERKTGKQIIGWPENLPDDFVLGWLIGGGHTLTVKFLTPQSEQNSRADTIQALEEWADGRFQLEHTQESQ